MKKYISIAMIMFSGLVLAQEDEVKKVDKPVRAPFESGYLLDNQTTFVPAEKTLELVIQHKFGSVKEKGVKDLFGIYAAGSGIRLGLNYVLVENLQIGYGITKNKMHSDFNVKWNILEQTRKNTMPVAVTIYANMGIAGNEDELYGANYKFTNRFSYFSQAIISRKFNDWLSLQTAASFTHYNFVNAESGIISDHNKIGLHFNGRAKFSDQYSFIFNYDQPLDIKGLYSEFGDLATPPKPNLTLGIEASTSTHAFQLYMGTTRGMLPQEVMYNNYDWQDGDFILGFTITRLWN